MQQEKCKRCRQDTLAGQSNGGRALALDVRLDVDELDPAGELDAILSGRHTWTVHHRMDGMDAWHRGSQEIRQRPAASRPRQAVHADHVCERGTA